MKLDDHRRFLAHEGVATAVHEARKRLVRPILLATRRWRRRSVSPRRRIDRPYLELFDRSSALAEVARPSNVSAAINA